MLLVAAVVGCDNGGHPVSIQSVEVVAEGRALDVTVDGCGQVAIDVDERADRVSLAASVEGDDGDCASGDLVQLDAPLGEREIVDALTGDTVPAGPPAVANSDPIVPTWPRSCWSAPTQEGCDDVDQGETFLAAGVGGFLAVHGGCVMAEWAAEHHAILFPHGTTWDPGLPGIRLPGGATVAIGTEFYFGGGGIHDRGDPSMVYNGIPIAEGERLDLIRSCMAASDHPDTLNLASPDAVLMAG